MSVEDRLAEVEGALEAILEHLAGLQIAAIRTQGAVRDFREQVEQAPAPGHFGAWEYVPLAGHDVPPRTGVRKYYALIFPECNRGIYVTYTAYAEAVRDHSRPWNGRSALHFAAGSQSQSFNNRVDVEAYFTEETRTPPLYRY